MIILILAGLGCLILLGIHSDDENGEFMVQNLTFRLKVEPLRLKYGYGPKIFQCCDRLVTGKGSTYKLHY